MRRLVALFLALLSYGVAYAGGIEHINYIELEVNGVKYEVPDANKEYRQEIYYLKKALGGDREAIEVLVGTKEYATLWIGDLEPRWLRLYRDGRAEVINP